MIKRNVTVKLQGSRAVVDSPIYLYQYDKNICLVITLLNNRYEYDKDTKLSFTLVKPNGATVESSLSAIIQGKYYITLTSEMLDGAEEVGQNLIQIRQHSDKGVVSLPPFAIHVLKSYVQPTSVDGIEDALLTENEYMLLTENQRAIEVFGTVKISELPTTTDIIGYVPITQDDTTYKLDISDFATKEDVANVTIDLSPYATKEDLVHNHDSQYAPKEHTHEQYLEEQDIEHLASKTYVANAITDAKVDLSGYATKDDLTQKADKEHEHSQYLTEHQDISHLASQAYVKNEIANAQLGGEGTEIDLSGYATKDDLLTKADKTELQAKADKEHTHDEYLTSHQDISHLATKADLLGKSDSNHVHSYNDLTDLPTIPSVDGLASEDYVDNAVANVKVDTSNLATKEELQNHKHDTLYAPINHEHDNYLTEHQSISHLATKADMLNKADKEHTHSYNDLEDKPTIPSVDGLASEDYVDSAIANIPLTDYALKTDLPTNTSDLTNDSGFITEVPSEYVTEEELTSKGYLTEHQSLEHLVTKEEFNAVANGIVTSTSIKSIELVDKLPSEQQQGVLYIVKASE